MGWLKTRPMSWLQPWLTWQKPIAGIIHIHWQTSRTDKSGCHKDILPYTCTLLAYTIHYFMPSISETFLTIFINALSAHGFLAIKIGLNMK